MTAFAIATIRVKDPEKLAEYSSKAGPTIAAFGGEMVMRGGFGAALLGETTPHGTGVIRFPDMAALEGWFASDAYQALAPIRDAGCDMTLTAYQIPA
ncbi:DUF1330 domain-containing protein [Actibacterium sp. D379-3]